MALQKKVGIVGSGAMGTGISMVFAQKGIRVVLFDTSEAAIEASRKQRESQWDRLIERDRATVADVALWKSLISEARDWDAFSGLDWAIEAVTERMAVKKDVVAQLDRVLDPEGIIATNTSSLSITEIAAATKRPDQVVGVHFFNPAPVMRLVEVIRGLLTTDRTVADTLELVRSLGKEPVIVQKDSPGFIVNRLMFAQMVEAIRLVEEGVASIEEVDKAAVLGLNHPMGPFQLQDYTGIDVCLDVLNSIHEATGESRFCPPLTMRLNVAAGRYGKKTGSGWYAASQ